MEWYYPPPWIKRHHDICDATPSTGQLKGLRGLSARRSRAKKKGQKLNCRWRPRRDSLLRVSFNQERKISRQLLTTRSLHQSGWSQSESNRKVTPYHYWCQISESHQMWGWGLRTATTGIVSLDSVTQTGDNLRPNANFCGQKFA